MSARSPYSGMTLRQLGERLRSGNLTCLRLMEQTLAFIKAQDPHIHAFVALDAEHALAAATTADADLQNGIDRGLLHGIPFAVKDMIDCAGFETGCGARKSINNNPEDAICVSILKRAGAIMLGKLNTYEFALNGPDLKSRFTPSRNPWNPEHITGGSSSGSAAAVASGMVAFALGTDTGGSIRSPASYCGCVGLKPTFGKFPMAGIVPLSPSMDVVGWLSRNISDNALVFDILSNSETERGQNEEPSGEIAGLKIGYARNYFAPDPQCSPAIITALDEAAAQLTLMGGRVQEVDLPDYSATQACGATLLRHEALQFHAPRLQQCPEIYHDFTRYYLLAEMERALSDDMSEARKIRQQITDEIEAILQNHDALLLATTLNSAPLMSDFADGRPRWTPMRTISFNLTGHPALALPAGRTMNGLPISLQLVAKYHDEAMLYRLASKFEHYSGWSDEQPELLEHFPKSVKRFLDKKCGKNK